MDDSTAPPMTEAVEGDNRLPRLTSVGVSLRASGASREALLSELSGINRNLCQPPLRQVELQQVVESVLAGERIHARTGFYSPAARPRGLRVVDEIKARFFTAAEIPTEARVEWLVPGLLAVGAITTLVGQAKVAGKTTLMLRMVKALVDGQSFLGTQTTKTPVVLLTEEGRTTLTEALRRAGLLGRLDLKILTYKHGSQETFDQTINAAVQVCIESGALLLVVDTLAQWSGLNGDSENSAGAALAAIRPLQAAAASALSVLVLHHEGKNSGSLGHAGRGSSAFSGAVDVILTLRRPEGAGHTNVRTLHGHSRFEETPKEQTIELVSNEYVSRSSSAVVQDTTRESLLATLPNNEEQALSVPQLKGMSNAGETTIRSVLETLIGQDLVIKIGTGHRGDPVRFYRRLDSSGTTTPGNSERTNESALVPVVQHLTPQTAPTEPPSATVEPSTVVSGDMTVPIFTPYDGPPLPPTSSFAFLAAVPEDTRDEGPDEGSPDNESGEEIDEDVV